MATVCDVTFRVGRNKKTLSAPRSNLVDHSQVFRAMLCGPLAERGQINIPDVESQDFKEFLEFLHTNACDINHDNVTTLLYLAKKYCVGKLELLCLKFLHKELAPENACVVMEHAHTFNEQHLYENAFKVIIDNIDSIGDDLCNLCGDCFHKIVTSKSLKTRLTFKATILWAEAQCRRQGREITLTNMASSIKDYFMVVAVVDMRSTDEDLNSRRLLSVDDLEVLMSFNQHKDKHRFLFKKEEFDGTLTTSVFTKNMFFYNNFQPSNSALKRAEDGMDFTFNTNVMLFGVYLFKPEGDNAHVRLTIQKFLRPICLEDNEYDVIIEDEDIPYVEISLNRPFPFVAGERYCMYASMENGRPLTTGDLPKGSVTVGVCTFTRENQEYVDTVNMIYGFKIGYLI